MSGVGRWLDPVDLGPFNFRPGGSGFPGGAAHKPDELGRIAFFAPGDDLPEGWVPGVPPRMDVEKWSRWAKEEEAVRVRGPDPWE